MDQKMILTRAELASHSANGLVGMNMCWWARCDPPIVNPQNYIGHLSLLLGRDYGTRRGVFNHRR